MNPELENIDQMGKNAAEHFNPPPPPMAFRKIRKRVLWYSIVNLGIVGTLRQYWFILAIPAGIFGAYFIIPPSINEKSELAKPALHFSESRIPAGSGNSNSGNIRSEVGENHKESINTFTHNDYNDHKLCYTAGSPLKNAVTQGLLSDNSRSGSNLTTANQSGNADQSRSVIVQNTGKNQGLSNSASQNEISGDYAKINISVDIEKQNNTLAETKSKTLAVKKENMPYLRKTQNVSAPFVATASVLDYPSYRRTFGWSVIGNIDLGTANLAGFERPADVKAVYSPAFQGGGFQIQVDCKRWFAGIGVEYSRNSFTYLSKEHLYNPKTSPHVIQSGLESTYDSTSFWHYTWAQDSVYHIVDSVWETIIDTTIVSLYDTLSIVRFDTLRSGKATQTVSLFMFPISFGYQIPFGVYEAGISAGFSAGVLTKVSGNLFGESTLSNPFIEASTRFKANYFVYSWTLSAYLRRSLSDRISIGVSPYYRSGMNFLKNVENGNVNKLNGLGVNFQIRYKIF